MSVKAAANRFPIDSLLVLRAAGQSAVTSDTNTSALNLNVLASYWQSDSTPAIPLDFALVATVEAGGAQTGAANETYVFEVWVDDATDFSGAKMILSKQITGTGRHVLSINRESVMSALAAIGATLTTGYLRVTMNVTGTGPSIAFGVYVAPEE